MADEYAVYNGDELVSQSPGYAPDRVTRRVQLSGGLELRVCGDSDTELQRRLSEAEDAIRARDTFLSNMSHDIRTPMNAIVGLTLLAKMHLDETARVSDALSKIETASGHLLSLINDVLDMSRINSGRMELSRDYFSLSDMMHEIYVIAQPQAEKKGQTLRFEADQIYAETLQGDALRLRQIFVNIIGNAVKYTPEGGHIDVRFEERERGEQCMLRFVCRDDGIGMSEEFLRRIYEPFERVRSTTVSRIEGAGLGMSIVKRLTESMSGDISIQSAPGEGTAVTIEIPMPWRQEALDSDAVRGRRLLILEGDAALRRAYSAYLGECGAECALVASVQEALNALADADIAGRAYDAIIIGREHGEGDKLDIAAYLHSAAAQLPLLLISDDNWDEINYRAERCGVSAFIPLPLLRKRLINGLSAALKSGAGEGGQSDWPDLRGRRLLLVEDNLVNMEIAKELLGMTGALTDPAEDGKQAVDAFSAAPEGAYTMILMDVQMPVMDGYQAARAIRALNRPDAATVPIYAMTANTFAEDIARARDAGMNGHLAKPIDINALMQALRDAAGR